MRSKHLKLRVTNDRQGITLLEVVLSSMLVGVTLVASLQSVGAVFRAQRMNSSRLMGADLAMEFMSEIMAMPYKDPTATGSTLGLDSGESATNRATFDDVDDYKDFNNLGVKARDGTAVAGLANWRRQVDVVWFDSTLGTAGILETDLKRITVSVTSPTGKVSKLTAYRSKWGMLEQTPSIDVTVVNWLGVRLQVGAGNPKVYIGTHLTNHSRDVP